MQANIRLGLAAGECVRENRSPNEGLARFGGFRAVVALASVTMVVAAGLMLQRPAPRIPAGQMMLQATADGIQVSKGGEALSMMHDSAIKNVNYSANTQGSIGATFYDPVTGDVTMMKMGRGSC